MTVPEYQPFKDKTFSAVPDSSVALALGGTSTLTGHKAVGHETDWRGNPSVEDYTNARIHIAYNNEPSGVLAGKGYLLVYNTDDQLVAKSEAALHLRLPHPDDTAHRKLTASRSLKRFYGATRLNYYNKLYAMKTSVLGTHGGFTAVEPSLVYHITLTNGSSGLGASELEVTGNGSIKSLYMVLSEDSYGPLSTSIPMEALSSATPEQLTEADTNLELPWLAVPLGGDSPARLSSHMVEKGTRLLLLGDLMLSYRVLSESRLQAAGEAHLAYARRSEKTFYDETTGTFCFGDNSVLDRSTVSDALIDEFGNAKINATGNGGTLARKSAFLSALTLPSTGRYYCEAIFNRTASVYSKEKAIAFTTDKAFRNWSGGWSLPSSFTLTSTEAPYQEAGIVRLYIDRDHGTAEAFFEKSGSTRSIEVPAEFDRIMLANPDGSNETRGTRTVTALFTTDEEFSHDRPMGYQCIPQLKDRRHQTGPYPYEEVMDWLSAQASDTNYPVKIDRAVPDSYQFARESVIQSALSLPDTGKFYFEVDLPTDVGYPLAEGETEVTTGNPYVTLALVPEGFAPSFEHDMRDTGYATFHLADHLDEAMAAGTLKVLVDQDAGTVSWQLGELTIDSGSFITTTIPVGSASRIMAGIVGAGQAGQYGTLRFRFKEEDFTGTLPEGYQPLPWSFSRA